MMNDTIEVRIGRYLAGEATSAERLALEQEMASDPSLHQLFAEYQKVWSAKSELPTSEWNAEKGWNRFKEENHQVISLRSNNRTRNLSWAVAAAMLLALGVAAFLWKGGQPTCYAFDPASKGPIVLADGTEMYLNEGSSAKAYSFNRNNRKVELNGEAFFNVAHDTAKPFIVKTGQTITEVVGTSFSIKQTDEQITIFVTSGKVIFRSADVTNIAVALTSGEAAIFKEENIERVPNPSPNMQAWHTRELKFSRNMPFGDIVADIGTYFKHEISFENENVKKCPVTIPLSFKEPKLEAILESVVASVNASYVIEGQKCIIKGGENCF